MENKFIPFPYLFCSFRENNISRNNYNYKTVISLCQLTQYTLNNKNFFGFHLFIA
jgi:hypothetical protein